ncbi:hypothetical protein X989_5523 [Burkholderia pseudomallei MSHR4378]|nr:hypothetical protein X989_5523 [Burkholderia pseudomallei MSHR4378]
MFDCAPAPRPKPNRLSSAGEPAVESLAGGKPRLTQCMPYRAANSASCMSMDSLSPAWAPELVKPAAILLRQRKPLVITAPDVASSKALNSADTPAM